MAHPDEIERIRLSLVDEEQRERLVEVHLKGFQNIVEQFFKGETTQTKQMVINELTYSFNLDYMEHFREELSKIDILLCNKFCNDYNKCNYPALKLII